MNPEQQQPEDEEISFMAFLEMADPAVHAWSQRATMTDDIRMATFYGELRAIYELGDIALHHNSEAGMAHVVGQFMAGRAALRRRRDSFRFVRALERHMKASPREDAPDGGSN
jgi:hypothetical protein